MIQFKSYGQTITTTPEKILEAIGKKTISHKIENAKRFKENPRKGKTIPMKNPKFFVTENN